MKLDDVGLFLSKKASAFAKRVGGLMVRSAPVLMKFLSIAGTIAMFLVGGGLFVHNVTPVHHFIEHVMPDNTGGDLLGNVIEALVGVAVGLVVFVVVELGKKIVSKVRRPAAS